MVYTVVPDTMEQLLGCCAEDDEEKLLLFSAGAIIFPSTSYPLLVYFLAAEPMAQEAIRTLWSAGSLLSTPPQGTIQGSKMLQVLRE